ncbi:DNA-directed RNA polymerase subunit omega, partial [Nonlabens tegetincola]
MDTKNLDAATTTITYNRDALTSPTGNMYEAISIIAKRAEQIKGDIKEELIEK